MLRGRATSKSGLASKATTWPRAVKWRCPVSGQVPVPGSFSRSFRVREHPTPEPKRPSQACPSGCLSLSRECEGGQLRRGQDGGFDPPDCSAIAGTEATLGSSQHALRPRVLVWVCVYVCACMYVRVRVCVCAPTSKQHVYCTATVEIHCTWVGRQPGLSSDASALGPSGGDGGAPCACAAFACASSTWLGLGGGGGGG